MALQSADIVNGRVASVIGIASLWLGCKISFIRPMLESIAFGTAPLGPASVDLYYLCFWGCAILLLAGIAAAGARFDNLFGQAKNVLVLAGALYPTGLVITLAAHMLDAGIAAFVIGALLAGFGLAVLVRLWGEAFAHVGSSASRMLSGAFLAQMLLSCLVALLPSMVCCWIATLSGIVSIVCLAVATRQLPHFGRTAGLVASNDGCDRRLLFFATIFIYIGAALWGLFAPSENGIVSLTQHLTTFLVAALVSAAILYLDGKEPQAQGFRLTVQSVIAVIFLASMFIVLLFGDETTRAGSSTFMAARFCLELLSWIILVGMAARQAASRSRIFGLGFSGLVMLPSLLGHIAFPNLVRTCGFSAGIEPDTVVLAATFALTVAAVVLVGSDGSSSVARSAANGTVFSLADLAHRYQLTPRETDVLDLLARGNSQKKISAVLSIAPATVQSHVKALYRKLGVHNRQELIDLVYPQRCDQQQTTR